jgi:hypothetical protein
MQARACGVGVMVTMGCCCAEGRCVWLSLLLLSQVKHMRSVYGSNVKFILMNSFSTSDDTKAFLSKSHGDLVQVSCHLIL